MDSGMNEFFTKTVGDIMEVASTSRRLDSYQQGLTELTENPRLTYHYTPTNLSGYYAIDNRGNDLLQALFWGCNNSAGIDTITERAKLLGLGVEFRATRRS